MAAEGEVLLDRVLAVVDNHAIFFSDIQRKIATGPLVAVSEYPAQADATPQTKALNDSINFELIMGAAKDLDLEVSEVDLDQEINRYLEEQHITKDKLADILKTEGETLENYRRDFRNQLILRRFQRRVILPSIKITDKDIETYFLSQQGSAASEQIEVNLKQIIIKLDQSMPENLRDVRKKLAQEVYSKLKDGMDFTEGAGVYSDDQEGKKTASAISVKLRDLSPAIRTAIEPLKQGEFTAPIDTGAGLIIFQLAERKIAVNRDFEAKKAQLDQELKLIELRKLTNKWVADQRQRATIKMIED